MDSCQLEESVTQSWRIPMNHVQIIGLESARILQKISQKEKCPKIHRTAVKMQSFSSTGIVIILTIKSDDLNLNRLTWVESWKRIPKNGPRESRSPIQGIDWHVNWNHRDSYQVETIKSWCKWMNDSVGYSECSYMHRESPKNLEWQLRNCFACKLILMK